jgi:hypothetical protein
MESRLNALNLLAAAAGPDELTSLFNRDVPARAAAEGPGGHRALRARAERQAQGRPRPRAAAVHEPERGDGDRGDPARGRWKLETVRPDLVAAGRGRARAAVDALAALGGEASVEFLKGLATSDKSAPPPPARRDRPGRDRRPGGRSPGRRGPDGDCTDVYTAFLLRKGGAAALLKAIDPKALPADAARLGLRAMYAAGLQEPALRDLLNGVVGLTARGKNVDARAARPVGRPGCARRATRRAARRSSAARSSAASSATRSAAPAARWAPTS